MSDILYDRQRFVKEKPARLLLGSPQAQISHLQGIDFEEMLPAIATNLLCMGLFCKNQKGPSSRSATSDNG
jgi:hypothetical protein